MTNVYTMTPIGNALKIRMTVEYLKQLLKERGVTFKTRMNKAELLELAISEDLLEWDSFKDAYIESNHYEEFDPETVTLYHGTNADYETFEDKDSQYSHGGNEGTGIYFTESEEFAASYGEHIHKIEVRKSDVHDFTEVKHISAYMCEILAAAGKELGVDFFELIKGNTEVVIQLVNQFGLACEGKSRISDLYEDCLLILDSNEQSQKVVESMGDYVYAETVERVFKDNLRPVFKFHDNDFKGTPIYVAKDADKLNYRMVTKVIYTRKK